MNLISSPPFQPRYAITFGEVAILHVGGKEIGNGRREQGFQVDELDQICNLINLHSTTVQNTNETSQPSSNQSSKTVSAELIHISNALPEQYRQANAAAVLVIRNGAELISNAEAPKSDKSSGKSSGNSSCSEAKNSYIDDAANKLLQEQQNIEYDRKFWNARQRKTMNKRARYNTTFGEQNVSPSADFQTPTTHAFPPIMSAFRNGLVHVLGERANDLSAEGNHYYEQKSGIGYHGDAERKIVICLCLGGSSVLKYNWRMPGSSEHTMKSIDVHVKHGDVYVMSEKATGFDWKSRSKIRVVHGAGSDKYVNPKKKKKKESTTTTSATKRKHSEL